MHTLVLNRSFYPVHVTSWRRALALVYGDAARVVDEDFRTYDFEDWRELSQAMRAEPEGFVHTPTFKIRIPEVIALRAYNHVPPTRVKFTRRNIYAHYGYRCCYCGQRKPPSELNLEHIVPRSRGGRTDWQNVVTACLSCNIKKGSRLPEEAGMRLVYKPHPPSARGAAALVFRPGIRVRASWQRFIDARYWDSELHD